MKQTEIQNGSAMPAVAPRAGAWIETELGLCTAGPAFVAPRAGAWIETQQRGGKVSAVSSPPARGRGLKLLCR